MMTKLGMFEWSVDENCKAGMKKTKHLEKKVKKWYGNSLEQLYMAGYNLVMEYVYVNYLSKRQYDKNYYKLLLETKGSDILKQAGIGDVKYVSGKGFKYSYYFYFLGDKLILRVRFYALCNDIIVSLYAHE